MGHRWLHWGGAGGGGGGGGGGGTDPLFGNVILLLPFDGADDDADVAPFNTDFSPLAQPVTINSLAKADVTRKFGTTSLWGLTTNNDSAQCIANPSEFTLLAKSWTMEMWILWAINDHRDHLNSQTWRRRTFIAALHPAGLPLFGFAYKPWNQTVIFEWRTDDNVDHSLETSVGLSTNVWHHVCVERGNDDILRIMLNGTVFASRNIAGHTFAADSSKRTWIGQQDNSSSSFMNGWIDEVRVTLDVARYGGSFTPPDKLPLS